MPSRPTHCMTKKAKQPKPSRSIRLDIAPAVALNASLATHSEIAFVGSHQTHAVMAEVAPLMAEAAQAFAEAVPDMMAGDASPLAGATCAMAETARVMAEAARDMLANVPPAMLVDVPPAILADVPPAILADAPPLVMDEDPLVMLADVPPAILADVPPAILADAPPAVMDEDPPADDDKLRVVVIPLNHHGEYSVFCLAATLISFGETLLNYGTGRRKWIKRSIGFIVI
jgi:hypothetical protein